MEETSRARVGGRPTTRFRLGWRRGGGDEGGWGGARDFRPPRRVGNTGERGFYAHGRRRFFHLSFIQKPTAASSRIVLSSRAPSTRPSPCARSPALVIVEVEVVVVVVVWTLQVSRIPCLLSTSRIRVFFFKFTPPCTCTRPSTSLFFRTVSPADGFDPNARAGSRGKPI